MYAPELYRSISRRISGWVNSQEVPRYDDLRTYHAPYQIRAVGLKWGRSSGVTSFAQQSFSSRYWGHALTALPRRRHGVRRYMRTGSMPIFTHPPYNM